MGVKFKSEEKMWLLFQQNIQNEELSSYVYLSRTSFKASKLTFIVMCLRMKEKVDHRNIYHNTWS